MLKKSLKSLPLALTLLCVSTAALSQSATPTTPAKKELIARLIKLQQPGIEAMSRAMVEQPAAQMLNSAGAALPARVAPDKQEAVGKEIQADTQKYLREAVPLVSERAIKLAPSTVGAVLDEKFSEDELRQILALLESPVYNKYSQLSGAMQQALQTKLVAETRSLIEPKLKTLESSIGKRLGMSEPAASKPAK